jgi:oxysterol-binding protein 1
MNYFAIQLNQLTDEM